MSEPRILPHHHGSGAAALIGHVPPTEQIASVADAMKQLGDPSRLQIFWILCHGEVCVANLSAMVGMSSPAVSHHLRILKDAGLITSHREGKEVCYRAVETPKTQLLHEALEALMTIQCPMEET